MNIEELSTLAKTDLTNFNGNEQMLSITLLFASWLALAMTNIFSDLNMLQWEVELTLTSEIKFSLKLKR